MAKNPLVGGGAFDAPAVTYYEFALDFGEYAPYPAGPSWAPAPTCGIEDNATNSSLSNAAQPANTVA